MENISLLKEKKKKDNITDSEYSHGENFVCEGKVKEIVHFFFLIHTTVLEFYRQEAAKMK